MSFLMKIYLSLALILLIIDVVLDVVFDTNIPSGFIGAMGWIVLLLTGIWVFL